MMMTTIAARTIVIVPVGVAVRSVHAGTSRMTNARWTRTLTRLRPSKDGRTPSPAASLAPRRNALTCPTNRNRDPRVTVGVNEAAVQTNRTTAPIAVRTRIVPDLAAMIVALVNTSDPPVRTPRCSWTVVTMTIRSRIGDQMNPSAVLLAATNRAAAEHPAPVARRPRRAARLRLRLRANRKTRPGSEDHQEAPVWPPWSFQEPILQNATPAWATCRRSKFNVRYLVLGVQLLTVSGTKKKLRKRCSLTRTSSNAGARILNLRLRRKEMRRLHRW